MQTCLKDSGRLLFFLFLLCTGQNERKWLHGFSHYCRSEMDKDVFTSTAELQTGLHPSAWVPSGVAAGLLALSESPGLF